MLSYMYIRLLVCYQLSLLVSINVLNFWSPKNIIWKILWHLLPKDDYNLRIIDFGLAEQLNDTSDHVFMTMCGTLEYMSPEVMDCKHASRASGNHVWELFLGNWGNHNRKYIFWYKEKRSVKRLIHLLKAYSFMWYAKVGVCLILTYFIHGLLQIISFYHFPRRDYSGDWQQLLDGEKKEYTSKQNLHCFKQVYFFQICGELVW